MLEYDVLFSQQKKKLGVDEIKTVVSGRLRGADSVEAFRAKFAKDQKSEIQKSEIKYF